VHIVIVGLRRSGTTIFWQTFRQDPRLLCFNEPFNPALRDVPIEIPNRSRAEFIQVFRKGSAEFWRLFAPISVIEELQEGFSDRQEAYLRRLAEMGPLCIDTTRCHFKIAALGRVLPGAVLVHLYRHPAAFATSHLIPTGSGGRKAGWLVRAYGQSGFWTRRERFNNWGMEELVGRHPESMFAHRLREIGLDPAAIYELPAAGRLLAVWRLFYETVERDGPRIFGSRFLSVPLEEFCARPARVIGRIYASLGLATPELDLSSIHPANRAHQAADPRWRALCTAVGLDAERPYSSPSVAGV
jgi:Sulfotransferase family